ncbi:MAG: hypothetical protein AAF927_02235 [Bacteroidota bacterium]
MIDKEIVPKVRNYIKTGKLAAAVDSLNEWSEATQEDFPNDTTLKSIYSTILVISGRFHVLKGRMNLGDISRQDSQIEEVKIQSAIVDLAIEIEGLEVEEKSRRNLLGRKKTSLSVSQGQKEKPAVVTITLSGNYQDWGTESQQRFHSAMSDLLSIEEGEVIIRRISPGSVLILCELPVRPFEKWREALEAGLLNGFNMLKLFIYDQLTFIEESPEYRIIEAKDSTTQKSSPRRRQDPPLHSRTRDRARILSEIILLIKEDRLEEAINLMLEVISDYDDPEIINQLIAIRARFNRLNERRTQALVSPEEFDVERRKIMMSLLMRIDSSSR